MNTISGRFAAVTLAILCGCQAPSYVGPGTEPKTGVPPPGPFNHRLVIRARTAQSAVAECDRFFIYTVEAKESVTTCAAYNFTALYNSANSQGKALAQSLPECPANCRPRHTWIQRSIRACENNVAQVVLEFGTLCPREQAKPPGVAGPPASGLLAPGEETAPPLPGNPPVNEELRFDYKNLKVACNPVELVEIEYRERVTSCAAANSDFRSFVEYARKQGGTFCAALSCAAGCTKATPPVINSTQWRCLANGKDVEVKVWVQCCR